MMEKDTEALVRAQGHLESWRRDFGGRGVRIPEELWGEAVEAAQTCGLLMTAQKLGLDRGRLEARVSLAEGQQRRTGGRREPVFVEVGMNPLGSGRAVVEFVSRDGDRMRIDVAGPSGVDVVGLSRTFWGLQP